MKGSRASLGCADVGVGLEEEKTRPLTGPGLAMCLSGDKQKPLLMERIKRGHFEKALQVVLNRMKYNTEVERNNAPTVLARSTKHRTLKGCRYMCQSKKTTSHRKLRESLQKPSLMTNKRI